jgi:hypothetical protein
MIASVEYKRVYSEISQLIEKKKYADAYVLVAELRDFATTKGQLIKASEIQDWLLKQLCLTQGKAQ